MSGSKIILGKDLKTLFFHELNLLNEHSLKPFKEEVLFYSSGVLENYIASERYFEFNEGKVREKILGQKLLQSNFLDGKAKVRAFQEVGETSLVLCGVFRDSLKSKLVDISFYRGIGENAFNGLNVYRPIEFNTHGFYQKISENFDQLTNLLFSVSKKLLDQDEHDHLHIKLKAS